MSEMEIKPVEFTPMEQAYVFILVRNLLIGAKDAGGMKNLTDPGLGVDEAFLNNLLDRLLLLEKQSKALAESGALLAGLEPGGNA